MSDVFDAGYSVSVSFQGIQILTLTQIFRKFQCVDVVYSFWCIDTQVSVPFRNEFISRSFSSDILISSRASQLKDGLNRSLEDGVRNCVSRDALSRISSKYVQLYQFLLRHRSIERKRKIRRIWKMTANCLIWHKIQRQRRSRSYSSWRRGRDDMQRIERHTKWTSVLGRWGRVPWDEKTNFIGTVFLTVMSDSKSRGAAKYTESLSVHLARTISEDDEKLDDVIFEEEHVYVMLDLFEDLFVDTDVTRQWIWETDVKDAFFEDVRWSPRWDADGNDTCIDIWTDKFRDVSSSSSPSFERSSSVQSVHHGSVDESGKYFRRKGGTSRCDVSRIEFVALSRKISSTDHDIWDLTSESYFLFWSDLPHVLRRVKKFEKIVTKKRYAFRAERLTILRYDSEKSQHVVEKSKKTSFFDRSG